MKSGQKLGIIGGIIIVAIIIVAVMSMNAPDGSVNTLTKLEPTDEGTYEVELVLSPAPIEPNKETGLRMRYVQAGKDIVQQHVDYSLFIEKEGKEIYRTPIIHSNPGIVDGSHTFPSKGDYILGVDIEGVLFIPIPRQTAIFSISVD